MDDATDYDGMKKTEDMLTKRENKKALLEKRDEHRKENIQQRRENDTERQLKREKYDYFEARFKDECNSIVSKLDADSLKGADKIEIAKHFEGLTQSFETLLKFLTDSTVFLRSFQLEQCQKTLGQIQIDISTKKQELLPKKKFAFKSNKKQTAAATPATESTAVARTSKKTYSFSASECGISDKAEETVMMPPDQINQRDVSLSKLKNSRVELPGYPGTVHLSDITNCVILCGPASGSVFVDNCVNSKIITGCQQLRVHNTSDTDFYLHVTSRAIIEDTTGVRFAPYNWEYENLDNDFSNSGLSKAFNNWEHVDDFNWLAMETASPNWSVLPESERVKEW